MPSGTGLGSLIPGALALVGIVSILRARGIRRNGRRNGTNVDARDESRQASAAEMERRMAFYLAGRDTREDYGAATDRDEQVSKR
jgi:hypothetical protein